jgi:hypothetical protein
MRSILVSAADAFAHEQLMNEPVLQDMMQHNAHLAAATLSSLLRDHGCLKSGLLPCIAAAPQALLQQVLAPLPELSLAQDAALYQLIVQLLQVPVQQTPTHLNPLAKLLFGKLCKCGTSGILAWKSNQKKKKAGLKAEVTCPPAEASA